MNLGYWNSCNPMNRMAHLNWKGTIRMKYSPRLKETITSIFHNRNSRISIHVIFTKVDFDSPKCSIWCAFPWFKMVLGRLVNILCVIWPYAVFNTVIYGFGKFIFDEILQFTFSRWVPSWFLARSTHLTEKSWIFSWNFEAVGSIPPEIRSTKMSIPVLSGSGV